MGLLLLYQIGWGLAAILPRPFLYWLARRIGEIFYLRSPKDRRAVRANLEAICVGEAVSEGQVRAVFQNFGMYLADFFRFGPATERLMKRWVVIEGEERLAAVLAGGRGVIGITAHLGNYELAGAVYAHRGVLLHAAVLNHMNQRVDRFFVRQRARMGVVSLPVERNRFREFLQAALRALKNNQMVAIVADRDYFGGGLDVNFFGKSVRMPRGPAALSVRAGAPILPTFLIREGSRFRFLILPPLAPRPGLEREEAVRELTARCADVIAEQIRAHPTQWYVFHEFWKPAPAEIL